MQLPRKIDHIIVPPIKCQGIKTKLVKFIANNIRWANNGVWYEPFVGSGVVLFNLRPNRAIVSDTNIHIIQFYNDLYLKKFNLIDFKEFLEFEGNKLKDRGKEHYYFIRDRFNQNQNSFDFLFLNRSCFNGLMRFNSNGGFNVPFGHKPERFRQSYITKILNQIVRVQEVMSGGDWIFKTQDWSSVINDLDYEDFVYLDPPYIGRFTDYYNQWDESDAIQLANWSQSTHASFALSMWVKNKYRFNEHLNAYWGGNVLRTYEHFYHLGSTENLRNAMLEGLVIKPESASILTRQYPQIDQKQLEISISDLVLPVAKSVVISHFSSSHSL